MPKYKKYLAIQAAHVAAVITAGVVLLVATGCAERYTKINDDTVIVTDNGGVDARNIRVSCAEAGLLSKQPISFVRFEGYGATNGAVVTCR